MNQAVEKENEDQNMHITEPEPQGMADQVGEKKIKTFMSFNLSRKV